MRPYFNIMYLSWLCLPGLCQPYIFRLALPVPCAGEKKHVCGAGEEIWAQLTGAEMAGMPIAFRAHSCLSKTKEARDF